MDRLISYYRMSTRTKKWTVYVFAPFLSLTTCNAWFMYFCHCKQCEVPPKKRLHLIDSKLIIAEILKRNNYTGKTSTKKNQQIVSLPVNDVWSGRIDHFPEHVKRENQMKCRFPGCPSKLSVRCNKYDSICIYAYKTGIASLMSIANNC